MARRVKDRQTEDITWAEIRNRVATLEQKIKQRAQSANHDERRAGKRELKNIVKEMLEFA